MCGQDRFYDELAKRNRGLAMKDLLYFCALAPSNVPSPFCGGQLAVVGDTGRYASPGVDEDTRPLPTFASPAWDGGRMLPGEHHVEV